MKKLIVIEGTDGSGKQTQSKLLKEYYESQGNRVVLQSFPNYDSPSSGPVKMYLGGELCKNADQLNAYQSSILFSVDRLCTLKQLEKQPADVWIFDRYVQSNLIHQGGKINDYDELLSFISWLNQLEYSYLKLPEPDMVIFLDMPPQKSMELAAARTSQKSGKSKDIHEQDRQHLIKAYEAGKLIARLEGWNEISCVDGNGELKSIEDIHKEIVQMVEEKEKSR